jgi:alpha,alpha-trehalose phosphorylase
MHNDFAGATSVETSVDGEAARVTAEAQLARGGTLRLRKYVAYHWAAGTEPGELALRAHRTLDRAAAEGYEAVERAHGERVAAFWARSDVEVDGAPEVQRACASTCSS